MQMTQVPFQPAAVATAIQALAASINVEHGLRYRRRQLCDVRTDANGQVPFPALAAEIERIAREAGLSFEWIIDDQSIDHDRPRLPAKWDNKFRRIEVSVSRGNSEGWLVRIAGVPRRENQVTPGDAETSKLIALAKFLGSRFQVAWLITAIAVFLDV
jgi:hypothetical protein